MGVSSSAESSAAIFKTCFETTEDPLSLLCSLDFWLADALSKTRVNENNRAKFIACIINDIGIYYKLYVSKAYIEELDLNKPQYNLTRFKDEMKAWVAWLNI